MPLRPDLSLQQQRVLEFIVNYEKQHNIPPLLPEIAAEIGSETPNAHSIVKKLEAKGYLTRRPSGRRRIILTDKAR